MTKEPQYIKMNMTECFNRAILTGIIDKSARDNVKSFPEEYLLIFMIFLSISLLVFLIIIYSKRKKTKRLIEDQTKFEILFHWNPEATAYLDPHHCVVNVNPVFEKLFGVSLREIKGKHINDIIIPDNLQKEALKIDLNPDKYTYYNTVREKRDGTSVSVSLSASTISINDKLYGYLVVYKDMTAYEIAQKALKESEERLRVIIDAMPIPILISRYPDGNILYANKHIGEMFGIPPEQLSTRKTEEFYFNPDDRPGLVEQLIKDGFLPSSEVHVKKEDGTPFWVIVSLQFMRYNNDQAILTSFYDITDRKQAEEALVESEERYRGLIESAREAIFSIDRKGTFLLMNSISAKRLGGTPENFIGKNMSELFPPHIVKSQMSSILKVFDTGNGVIEESVTVLQGEERQYRTSLQPIRDHSGEITSVLGIARDISEIVHTQQKLKEERDFISSLLDTANSLIVCLDKNAKITIFNKECERVTGYTRGEVIGKSWKEIFLPKEDHHEGLNNFSEWVRKQPRDMYDSLIKTKSGLTRTILWSNSVIFSSDSDDLTAIAVGQDITEMKNAEAELKIANQERYNQAKEIAGGIAHEIYNSLFPATSSIDKLKERILLKKQDDLERNFKLLELTETAVVRAIKMTEIVSQFSRLELAKDIEIINLNAFFNDLIKGNPQLHKDKVSVILNIDDNCKIKMNRLHAFSLFNNIIINSLDALTEIDNKEIKINIFQKSENIVIEIVDTGTGILPEIIPKIFNPFFSTKPGTGTGLGLAICKKIVDIYKGEIKVESHLDTGTKFVIFLLSSEHTLLGNNIDS